MPNEQGKPGTEEHTAEFNLTEFNENQTQNFKLRPSESSIANEPTAQIEPIAPESSFDGKNELAAVTEIFQNRLKEGMNSLQKEYEGIRKMNDSLSENLSHWTAKLQEVATRQSEEIVKMAKVAAYESSRKLKIALYANGVAVGFFFLSLLISLFSRPSRHPAAVAHQAAKPAPHRIAKENSKKKPAAKKTLVTRAGKHASK